MDRAAARCTAMSRSDLPTFHQREEAVHLHTASRVGDAQGAAGDQALLGRAPFRGADQTPAWPVAGPLQQLHRLPHLDGQLAAVACAEVLEDHGQLASAGDLWWPWKGVWRKDRKWG